MSSDGWAETERILRQVLDNRAIFPVYQPIVDLASGSLVAVEALARGPAGSPIESPAQLFAAASRAGCLPEVDMLCGARALEIARDQPDVVPPLVFVNAEPAAFARPLTPDLVKVISDDLPYRIVLEFTERSLGAYPPGLLNIASMVHSFGNALALDDVGADPLSLAFLPLIEPEVVKLDMHLIRQPEASNTVETAAVIGAYAERTGAVVVAEGIETEQDVMTALTLGARWGQGWFCGRPGPLQALAGRPIHPYARLRPARGGLHLPTGTPYATAATRQPTRSGNRRLVDQFVEHLLGVAGATGHHSAVLAATPDPAMAAAWASRMASIADAVAFVGLAGPMPASEPCHRLRRAPLPPDSSGTCDSTIVVIGPHFSAALCAQGSVLDDRRDFVLTHDADLVHTIGRMLLHQLDTAGPLSTPVTTSAGGSS